MMPRYQRRQLISRVAMLLCTLAMLTGLGFLAWILSTLLWQGLPAFNADFFLQSTPAPGSQGGGLANAITGSLLIVFVSTAVATPIGILAGIYLAEFGERSRFAALTRLIVDVMLSAPSIVIGLFIYALLVATTGHFSGWAGSVALALLAIPVVVRTTDNMLRLVPGSLREAAFALGVPRWRVNVQITLKAVRSGIVTGLLLTVARMLGETAPLLFTALNNQFFSTDMGKPMANLPVLIYNYAMSPYPDWQRLAWGGATLITLAVLALNIGARVLFRDKTPGR